MFANVERVTPSPEPHYAVLNDIWGSSRYARSEKLPNASLSKLFVILDEAFEDFLHQRLQTADATQEDAETSALWKEIVRQRKLSSVVQELFGSEMDFSDTRRLSPQELMDRVLRLSEIGDAACVKLAATLVSHPYGAWKSLGSCRISPPGMEVALRILFNDEDGLIPQTNQMMILLHFFKGFLIKSHLFSAAPTSDEIATQQRATLAWECNAALNSLINALARKDLNDKTRCTLLHNLLELDIPFDDFDIVKRFSDEAQVLAKSSSALSADRFIADATQLLRTFFPSCYQPHIIESHRITVIERGDPAEIVYCAVLPISNFFFSPEALSGTESEDWKLFPREGNLERGGHTELVAGLTNISVFDAVGRKVFWGDLRLSAIERIRGPYYVLSEGDSYFSIPEWATKATRKAIDPCRPEGALFLSSDLLVDKIHIDTDYMRVKAIGMIKNGAFIRNVLEGH